MNTPNIVRFGVVGCGAISTQHFEAIDAVEGARLVAVASASIGSARAAGERRHVPWMTELDDLVARDDVDAVVLCTPSGLHAKQAIVALRHGKHVIIEKPIALSDEDANAVIAEGIHQRRTVGVISQRRFDPILQQAHSAVTNGALGRPILIVGEALLNRPQTYYDSALWRGTRSLDGGVLMNQAIHIIDLVRWIGGPVSSITAKIATLNHQMEAEDTAILNICFCNGSLGLVFASTSVAKSLSQELRIYGDRGNIRIVGDEAIEWNLVDGKHLVPAAKALNNPSQALAPATWGTDASGHILQYTDFVSAVINKRAPRVTGEDGQNALRLVTAAYEADQTGQTIIIKQC